MKFNDIPCENEVTEQTVVRRSSEDIQFGTNKTGLLLSIDCESSVCKQLLEMIELVERRRVSNSKSVNHCFHKGFQCILTHDFLTVVQILMLGGSLLSFECYKIHATSQQTDKIVALELFLAEQ